MQQRLAAQQAQDRVGNDAGSCGVAVIPESSACDRQQDAERRSAVELPFGCGVYVIRRQVTDKGRAYTLDQITAKVQGPRYAG